jgi:hypothetical protein
MMNILQNSVSTVKKYNCFVSAVVLLCMNVLLEVELEGQVTSGDLNGFSVHSVGPGIQNGSVRSIDFDLETPYNVYGAMADLGFWSGPIDAWAQEGVTSDYWNKLGIGAGSTVLTDRLNPMSSYFVYEYGGLGLWDRSTGGVKRVDPWAPEGIILRHARNPPAVTGHQDFSVVYYGSQFVHKSINSGVSWQIISGDLTNGSTPGEQADIFSLSRPSGSGPAITKLAVDPLDQEVIWAATDDGNLYLTRSGGGQWENKRSRIRGLPKASIAAHIHVSSVSAGSAFVAFENLEASEDRSTYIYKTEDYGSRWDRISEDRDVLGQIHTLVQDVAAEELLFVGAEDGLYVSLNGGEDWIKWPDSFPTVPVQALAIHPTEHDLILGTNGRNVLILDGVSPLREMAKNPQLSELEIFLFEQDTAYIHVNNPASSRLPKIDGSYSGSAKPYGLSFYYWINDSESTSSVRIEVLDFENEVIRTFLDYPERGVNHFVWDLREEIPEHLRKTVNKDGDSRFQGIEVLPGSYTVRVERDLRTVEQRVEVVADSRGDIQLIERITKYHAMKRYFAIEEKVSKMQAWVDRVSQGISEISAYLAEEPTSIELEGLRSENRRLRDEFVQVGDFSKVYQYREQVANMTSSYDAPTEGQRLDLLRMEEAAEELFEKLKDFSYTNLKSHSEKLKLADIGPLLFLGFMPIG